MAYNLPLKNRDKLYCEELKYPYVTPTCLMLTDFAVHKQKKKIAYRDIAVKRIEWKI